MNRRLEKAILTGAALAFNWVAIPLFLGVIQVQGFIKRVRG